MWFGGRLQRGVLTFLLYDQLSRKTLSHTIFTSEPGGLLFHYVLAHIAPPVLFSMAAPFTSWVTGFYHEVVVDLFASRMAHMCLSPDSLMFVNC